MVAVCLQHAAVALGFVLQRIQMQGEQIAHRVGWLNSRGNTPLAEKILSSVCTRCSSCCARQNRSPIDRSAINAAVCSTAAQAACASPGIHTPGESGYYPLQAVTPRAALTATQFPARQIDRCNGRHEDEQRLEAQAALFQADVALLAEDDVVEQLDLQRLARAPELLGRADILQ
jgi:hypothetical protein